MAFCGRCGAQNDETARFCNKCATPIMAMVVPGPPAWVAPPPMVPVVPVAYIAAPRKSVGAAIVLTIFFGPLGMLYSTVAGALVMFFVSIILAVLTAGISLLITWPICIVWSAIAANSYNEGRQTV